MLGLVWEITERITTTTTTTVNCFYSPSWSGFEMDLVVAQLQHSGAVSNPRVYSITVLYYLHSSSAFLFWFHPIKTDSFAGTKRDGTQPTHTSDPRSYVQYLLRLVIIHVARNVGRGPEIGNIRRGGRTNATKFAKRGEREIVSAGGGWLVGWLDWIGLETEIRIMKWKY